MHYLIGPVGNWKHKKYFDSKIVNATGKNKENLYLAEGSLL